MSSSTIESKIQDLQARLNAENRSREREPALARMDDSVRDSPRHAPTTHRPRALIVGDVHGTPSRSRRHMMLPVTELSPRNRDSAETDKKLQEIMKQSGILTINGIKYQTDIKDMEHLGELGNGTCGHVVKMLHKPSGEVIAVKQMRRTGNSEENKRIVMDIDVVYKSYDCPFIVKCLGCFIMESEVWICMELMATCFDKLLKRLKTPMPEEILGKVTVATVRALLYLKEKHDLIHRDVKPSNILLSERGHVKLCDFGISGRLVDSKAKTKSAGCAAYMAPERIDPPDPNKPDYDIRADVWSLGITLVELALGSFPYQDCKTEFEVVCRILHDNPPSLPDDPRFSDEFKSFVACCLTKDYKKRPKYPKLLEHPFLKKYELTHVPVDQWFARVGHETDPQAVSVKLPVPSSTAARRLTASSPTPSIPRRNQPSPHSTSHNGSTFTHSVNGITNGGSNSAALPPRPLVTPSPTFNYSSRSPPDRELDPGVRSISPFQRTSQSPPNFHDSGGGGGRFSPFNGGQQARPSPEASRLHQHRRFPSDSSGNGLPVSPYQQRRNENFWQAPLGSPLPTRKRYQNLAPEPAPNSHPHYNLGNTSPIVLQRFYHQQSQLQREQNNREYYSHLYNPTTIDSDKEDPGKRRFASYFKLQLGSDRRRTQSPDPPPRLSRCQTGANGDSSQSPLAMRRSLLEAACPGSPSLSRRYISPSPPQPPPRRLNESSSVPGSPQHVRARFHYTPEPQRRLFRNNDLS